MLSRYRIIKKLGAGGIGFVYQAEDLKLKRPVALKFLKEESLNQKHLVVRFLREARLAAALNHPNICTIHEVAEVQQGEEDALGPGARLMQGTPFIAMEFIEGQPLSEIIQEKGALPLEKLLEIAVQIAEGIAAAHAGGIVHRDLKPQNVMTTKEGRVKILDFGLAKPLAAADAADELGTEAQTLSAEMTREGIIVGTVAYMS